MSHSLHGKADSRCKINLLDASDISNLPHRMKRTDKSYRMLTDIG